jgi:DNA-3-methyladenine glycosylase II
MTELDVVHQSSLSATAPFDLTCSLRALAGFAPCTGDQLVAGDSVRKAFTHPTDPDQAVVAEIGPRLDGAPGVALTVHARERLAADEIAAVETTVERWLGLSEDRAAFLSIARGDPAMARFLAVAEGLHQVRFPSLAEGAAFFALTQNSASWFAAARKRRLASERGPRARLDGISYVAFPAMRRLTELSGDDLVRYAGTRPRAERLQEVLAGVAALDEEWLRTAPYDTVRAALLAIRGVGGFTAHAILLRVLGRPDDVPLEMAQFTRVGAAVYGDPPPAPEAIRERYGPWVGWWAYLARTALSWTEPKTRTGRAGRAVAPPAEPAASAQCEVDSSQRSNVRTPQPVAPFASSPSAASDQADDDMSRWAHRSRNDPVNSRKYSAAITAPAPTSVELTRSATSLPSAST